MNCICLVFVEGTEMVNESISESPVFKSITERVGLVT